MARPGYYYFSNLRSRRVFWMFFLLLGLLAAGKSWSRFTQRVTLEYLALSLYDHRIAISALLLSCLGIFLFTTWLKRESKGSIEDNYYSEFEDQDDPFEQEPISDEDIVFGQEEYRKRRGFKPGWLYYQCRDRGLLATYERLLASGYIERPRPSIDRSSAIFDEQPEESDLQNNSPMAPHAVLGVSESASLAEIKLAYREAMKGYHPDRVHGLATELQDLARRRATEINGAYEKLRKARSN